MKEQQTKHFECLTLHINLEKQNSKGRIEKLLASHSKQRRSSTGPYYVSERKFLSDEVMNFRQQGLMQICARGIRVTYRDKFKSTLLCYSQFIVKHFNKLDFILTNLALTQNPTFLIVSNQIVQYDSVEGNRFGQYAVHWWMCEHDIQKVAANPTVLVVTEDTHPLLVGIVFIDLGISQKLI